MNTPARRTERVYVMPVVLPESTTKKKKHKRPRRSMLEMLYLFFVICLAAFNAAVVLFALAISIYQNFYGALLVIVITSLVFWGLWAIVDALVRKRRNKSKRAAQQRRGEN